MTTEKQNIGKLGEDIAVKFLNNKGFHVKTRNYRKIFGELDIVAEKRGKVHFVEVKTLSYETGDSSAYKNKPEDSVHYRKRERLKRAIQGYLRNILFHMKQIGSLISSRCI